MNILADRYQFRARSVPEFLTTLPLCLMLGAYIDNKIALGFLSLALFFIFFQGHFSAKKGRNLQEQLRNDGKLKTFSTYILDEYAKDKKAESMAVVVKMAKKAKLDNPLDVSRNSSREKRINRVNIWLRENTRDIEKFPALFDKNCDYGFYRNMLAMKKWAFFSLFIATICFISPSITIIFLKPCITFTANFFITNYTLEVYSLWVVLALLWILFWCRVASLKSLQEANEEYIKALLNTADSVEYPKNKKISSSVIE